MSINKDKPWIHPNVDVPEFDGATRIHDWRNHVGERTQKLWDTFSHEQRLAIAMDAEDAASNEEWD